jgi:hypothetical protein
MEISNARKIRLKEITQKYEDIHRDMHDLQDEISILSKRRDKISIDLSNLRDEEILLINKIETENGKKLTQEILTEIVNS